MMSDFSETYRLAREGDRDAFESIVEDLRERLLRFIDRRMGAQVRRKSEPADIYQNVVLTLLDRLSRYPGDLGEDELRGYVFQIAKWKIADVMKKGTREGGESLLPPGEVPLPADSVGPITRADERRWTQEQIASLADKYAIVLRHYYVEGASVVQISKSLGLSEDAVKQRLSRGRNQLKERLGP
ncbi:MAG: sigma-70 family RNA polymerase sigma factor [Planctomycetota bacterium]